MTGAESGLQEECVEAARTPPRATPPPDFADPAAEIPGEPRAATGAERRYKVLCIADDPDCADLLREELERRGFAVSVAGDALQGLAQLLKWQPDLVLSEIGMPGMSGLDILKRLHQIAPSCARTPFIFLTGLSERESRAAGRTVAAEDFFAKPVDIEALLESVEARLAGVSKVRSVPMRGALTEREIEALMWAARGKTRTQIAEIMGITIRTVVFHLNRAQTRLGAATFTEAVVKAAMQGLIEP